MRTALCRIALCAAGALWLHPGLLRAQAPVRSRPLTLAEARAMAQRASPDLAAARHRVAAAAGRERQAGAFPNPTLSYDREQVSREDVSSSEDVVALSQPVEIGRRGVRREAARFARSAAEARLAAIAAEIDYEVARSYAFAVAAERRAGLAEAAAAAFARAGRVSEARLGGGDVSGYQHRRLALESARYAALRAAAVVTRDSAIGMLASLTGLADSAGWTGSLTLSDTLTPAALAEPVDSFVAHAFARRPELRAAMLEAEAVAAESRLAGAERIPVPVVSGGYKHERDGGRTLGGFVAGVSLPLPLWDRRSGAVEAARAEAAARGSGVEALRRRTAREVTSAYASHQALADQLALLDAQLGEGAATARRAADAAYAEGEIGLLEWLDSVRAWQEAEAAYATLWAEYVARRAALERATGATLF